MAWIKLITVGSYVIFCLPFSMNVAITLLLMIFDPDDVVTMDPMMMTVLHTLCILHFSLNFLIYTVIPSPMRERYCTVLQRVREKIRKDKRMVTVATQTNITQLNFSLELEEETYL